MSDATSLAPRSSPVPTEKLLPTNLSYGEEDGDAYIEQRSSSVMRAGVGEDAEGEIKSQNKQRRKRTRPEDQATLEDHYKQNPKPNKAARAEIVEEVSLNEKEVQIWFQNRRQINRRKARPLLPHEMVAFGFGGLASLSSDPITSSSCSGQETEELIETKASQEEPGSSDQECLDPTVGKEMAEPDKLEVEEVALSVEQPVIPPQVSGEEAEPIVPSLSRENSGSFSESVSKSFTSTPGYLSNRWNTAQSSFSTPATSQAPVFTTPPVVHAAQPNSCPERIGGSQSTKSPRVRLSMSLDGKAELVLSESSPSPPREITPRPSSSSSFVQQKRRMLQRSQSALPLTFPRSESSPSASFAPRISTGRSRDARTWEFCCDADIADELTTQAETESTGSAIAAISVLRSTSGSIQKQSTNKRSSPDAKQGSNLPGKKAKLGRATSSLARLQNASNVAKPVPSEKDLNSKDDLTRSPSGDSDKENWVPAPNGANPGRRPLPSGKTTAKQPTGRAVLGDNHSVASHAVNFGGPGRRRRKHKNMAIEILEDQENAGGEVAKFMRGEISPSKKGDLDCVQGLLSLSQGNWR